MGLNNYAIKLIKKYQESKDVTIGSGRCKHYPSCSNYGIECYQKFNFIKATFLTTFRILRCNPFTKKTYDPVPLTKEEKKQLKLKYEKLLIIVPHINDYINNHPNKPISEYVSYIYDFTFKDGIINDNLISLYYDYLYVFKCETKNKNIYLNYKEVVDYLNSYLTQPFNKKETNRN